MIEVYYNQQWLPVLDANWTVTEAAVICNQLGYEAVANVYTVQLCSNPETYISTLHCAGGETSILQCDVAFSSTLVPNSSACAVSCAGRLGVHIEATTGLLTLYYNGEWAPVCADTITEPEADVICRELGYAMGDSGHIRIDDDANSTALYIDVNCTGYEFLLSQCSYDEIESPSECLSVSNITCFGHPPPVCSPLLLSTTCDSVTLAVTASYQYHVQYKAYNATVWTVTASSNETSAVVQGLLPATAYQFSVFQSDDFGNSTLSDSLLVVTESPKVPGVKMLLVGDIVSTQVTLSWQLFDTPLCPALVLSGFRVYLNDSIRTTVVQYTIDQLVNSYIGSSYSAVVTRLTEGTLYGVTVQAVGTIEGTSPTGDLLYGTLSEQVEFTTTAAEEISTARSFLSDTFLADPVVSLVVLIILLVLITLIASIGISLFLCALVCRFQKKKRKEKMRISNLYYDDTEDHVYTTGDLSDQSYIPMSSTSVQNNTPSLSNVRRASNTERPAVDSFWNEFSTVPELSTFTSGMLPREENGSDLINETAERRPSHRSGQVEEDDSNDHPYDEIPGTAATAEGLVIARQEIDGGGSDTEDNEKVYDEIPPFPEYPSPKSSQDGEVMDLPPCPLTLSQEPSELTPHFIAPPREFADLPKRRSATVSGGVPMYTQPKPRHKRHHSLDESDEVPRRHRMPKKHSLKTSSHVELDKKKPYKTRSTSRLDMVINRSNSEGEDGEPPRGRKARAVTTSNESLLNDSEGRVSSPEYETLVHPESIKMTAVTSTAADKPIRRHIRPPPPVPSRPPSRRALEAIKATTLKQ